MDESKNERKLTKGELNFKLHPMMAIKRDLKCNCCNDSKSNNLVKYPLSENDVFNPEFQSYLESH